MKGWETNWEKRNKEGEKTGRVDDNEEEEKRLEREAHLTDLQSVSVVFPNIVCLCF